MTQVIHAYKSNTRIYEMRNQPSTKVQI